MTQRDRKFHRATQEELVRQVLHAQGDRSNRALARELGLDEGMVRAFIGGRSDPGADTLGALLYWNPALEPYILDDLRERGLIVKASREEPEPELEPA